MLQRIRTVLIVMDCGSLNQAATRLGVSQPTLTRQLQALEQEIGGALFERDSTGVRPTDLAFTLRDSMVPVLKAYDLAWAQVIAHAQGRESQLRIGYLGLAAARFLTPVLGKFQEAYPDIELWLFDQTPKEQLAALSAGDLDLALIGQEGAALGDTFYRQKIAKIGVRAVLPSSHPLAQRKTLTLADLKGEKFIAPTEAAVPGRKKWMLELCREVGFRPRWIAGSEAVAETFTRVAGERAVTLLPDYMEPTPPPGIAFVSVSDRHATWDFTILRQRGKLSPACRDLIRWITEAVRGRVK